MCDACKNKAREFVATLSDRQREGFEAYEREREHDEHRHQFDLGFDSAKAEDNVIYERIAEMHEQLREKWARINTLEADEMVKPSSHERTLEIARLSTEITELLGKLPADLAERP